MYNLHVYLGVILSYFLIITKVVGLDVDWMITSSYFFYTGRHGNLDVKLGDFLSHFNNGRGC